MSEVYQLTEFQFSNLVRAANKGPTVFAVLHSAETDEPKRKEALDKELQDIKDLVRLKLLKDISDLFTEQIQLSKVNNNRAYMVVQLTDIGKLCFKRGKNSVN